MAERHELLAIAIAIIATLVGGGCNSGGSSSSGAGSETGMSQDQTSTVNGVALDVTVNSLDSDRLLVDFDLQSSPDTTLGVHVEYSEDLGNTFQLATVEEPPTPPPGSGSQADGYFASATGEAHQTVWTATTNVSTLPQQDLVVRITPFNLGTGDLGAPATSSRIELGSGNPPEVTAISTPSSTVGGWVSFTYTVRDDESDYVSIEAEVSTDGGGNYTSASLAGGDGTVSVSTSPAAVQHTVQWHAQGDLPETSDNNVRLRLRATDTVSGSFASTGNFSIRTYSPEVRLLSVNGIPASMNGSAPFLNTANNLSNFTLLAPEYAFLISVELGTHVFGATLDPAGLWIANSVALGGGAVAGGFDAGQDFGPIVTVNPGDGAASLLVDPSIALPSGAHTLTATIRDVLGNVSPAVTFSFNTEIPTGSSLPFEASDNWHITFTRDNFNISFTTETNGDVTVNTVQIPNGVSDFIEDLRILGLNHPNPPPAAAAAGLNDIVLSGVKDAVIGRLNTLFGHEYDGTLTPDSPNIRFFLTQPPGPISRIAVGGDDPVPGFTIGRAAFDYRNSSTNDNTSTDLGVFSNNLIQFYINSSFTFKSRFDPLIPGRGTPIGDHPVDTTVLSPGFDRADTLNPSTENNRYDDIAEAIDALGRILAVILAHEIGHSIGLVANSAPTTGLFGGEFNASFAGPFTSDFHLDTPGNNIMAASISFSGGIATGSGAPKFNEMNRAYLLERILLK